MSTWPLTISAESTASRYRMPLISYFRRRGVADDECEDLAQEVLLRVSRKGSGDAIENPEAYVFSSASSVFIDHVRKRKSHCADSHDDLADAQFESEAPGPLRVLQGKEALRRLGAILEELPPRTREILLLSRLEGLTMTQLATRFGISVSAIEKHLARGLMHVRRRYADDE